MSAKWFETAEARGVVVRADATAATTDPPVVRCALTPFYEEGIAFDWSTLHARLVKDPSEAKPLESSLDALTTLAPKEGQLITTLKVLRLWEQTPLTAEASQMSVVRDMMQAEGNTGGWWRFVKGCAGQRSTRNTAWNMMLHLVKQLREGGIPCCAFLDTVVITSDEFNVALTRTAAVYKALKGAGLTIDARRSNLEPRPAVGLTRGLWTTLRLSSLKEDLLPPFLVDAFFQKLQDAYEWASEAPLLSVTPQELQSLFVAFCRSVAKKRAGVGLSSDLDCPLLDAGCSNDVLDQSVRELCAPLLVSNSLAEQTGQPRWSALELRLFLALLS